MVGFLTSSPGKRLILGNYEERYCLICLSGLQSAQVTDRLLADMAEQRQAEQEIRARSQFLERLIQQSPLPTFVLDDEGILLMVNEAFLEYFAVPDEDTILGRNALTEPANVKHGVVRCCRVAESHC